MSRVVSLDFSSKSRSLGLSCAVLGFAFFACEHSNPPGDSHSYSGQAGSELASGGKSGSGGTRDSAGAAGLREGGSANEGGSPNDGSAGGTAPGGNVGQGDAGAAGSAGSAPEDDGPPTVLMRSYDLQRTGSNRREIALTPSVVKSGGFGKLFCRPVDDEIYGQLLYVPQLDLGDGVPRNVLYAVTMNDSVYAYDADDGTGDPLFHTSLIDRASDVSAVPTADLGGQICATYRDISHQVGITSTPTIDLDTQTLYVVARSKESGDYVQRLHALSLLDGSEREHSPVVIDASVDGNGDGAVNGKIKFDPRRNNQRAALLLHEGVIYIAFASHCDGGPYHGWLLGYDAASLEQKVVYNVSPTGRQGGIWMAGAGPAVDADGNIYLVTGNGSADLDDSGPNRGEAFIKFKPTSAGVDVLDWFTPSNYDTLEAEDRDLGSSGPVLIPNSNLLLSGNKDGSIYVLDRSNLGKFKREDSNIKQKIAVTGDRKSHIHGTPVHWKSTSGEYVYVMGEEDHLKQYQLEGGKLTLAHSSELTAPIDAQPVSGYTMPGGILTLSANQDSAGSGIVWANLPSSQDANQAVVPGVLRAFDAGDVTKELWNSDAKDSDQFGDFAKFNPPTVVNGKVYVPTFSGQFCVYGVSDGAGK